MSMLPPEGISPTDGPLTPEELALATRNRGMPLEALRYDVTPDGLHYLLVHYDIPHVDPVEWTLRVGGAVSHPLTLSLSELQAMPSRSLTVTLECAGNGRARLSPRPVSNPWLYEAIGTATWTGVPLRHVLDLADVLPEAADMVFTGADHGTEKGVEQDYQRSLSVADAKRSEMLLAYAMNGRPLPPQHGAPLRLVVPGWYGMASVKWLVHIDASPEPFDGFQMRAYSMRESKQDAGARLSRIAVRSLMVPPGFPDYLTRRRVVDAGAVTVRGRAWAGGTPIARVELGVDGDWIEARVAPAVDMFAWSAWEADWDATPGEHVLSCRATDAAGNSQPDDPPWNYGGFANNTLHVLPVAVR